MKFKIRETRLEGLLEIIPGIFVDERGLFVKTFHVDVFKEIKLETCFQEEYYTASRKGVLRGLHFQLPPMDYTKIVYCVYGKVLDAVVDLRVGSSTYGKFETFELSDEKANIIYIPNGMAHGFYVLSETAILLYKVSKLYSPSHDSGVLWNSVGIPWPDKNPILSKRDTLFIPLRDFKSPFVYKGCNR